MPHSEDASVINGRYEVRKHVGRGGMTDVFSARDLLLDRPVAIKVLLPEFATDESFVERFRREAQSAANLSHPNIVNVYDWGKYGATFFIAMEQVEGRTLTEILAAHGHITARQAAEIASEVAAALGFAHESGLVHCDIKPANILIGANGQVKVTDFGLARSLSASVQYGPPGAVLGTATYFSPEQAQGEQPGLRSDLYSLGIVMYEMVAGEPPFTEESAVAIAYKQVKEAPQSLRELVPDIPVGYERIVHRLLAKDPELRYPDASALRADLRLFRQDEAFRQLAGVDGKAEPGYVFVSYDRDDQEYVDELCASLRRHSIEVWVDHEIGHSKRWEEVLQAQIEGCAAFVVVMTPSADSSKWVKREINHAEEHNKPIFPVLVAGECFFRLNDLQYEDARQLERSDGPRLPSHEFFMSIVDVLS